MPKRFLPTSILLVLAGLLLAGCGSSDSDSGSTVDLGGKTNASQGTAGKNLKISMDDYSFNPHDVVAAAGKVKITVVNAGKMPHELVLLQTDQDPGKLKTNSSGEVEEDAYKSPGEIADVAPGKSASKTFDLKPGKYAIVCNLPGHYKAGMYGSLTVTSAAKSSDTADAGSDAKQQPTTAAKSAKVDAGDFFFKPKDVSVGSGKVKITSTNVGKVEHELVLLQTDENPADLKQKNGEVDEEAYKVPGEIGGLAPGSTKSASLKLTPGNYAMICNLPGHYKLGMYGSVKVQ